MEKGHVLRIKPNFFPKNYAHVIYGIALEADLVSGL